MTSPIVFDKWTAIVEKLGSVINSNATTLSANRTWTDSDERTGVFTCASSKTITMAVSTEIEGALYTFMLKVTSSIISVQSNDSDSLGELSNNEGSNILGLLFSGGVWNRIALDIGKVE